MRISPETLRLIKELAIKYFGEDCEVKIFGSRIDDTKRGGDIDIYVETSKDVEPDIQAMFLAELKIKAGDQKIDLLVQRRDRPKKDPVFEYAKNTGVKI